MSFLSELAQAGKDAGDSPEDIAGVLDLAHADIAAEAGKSKDPDEVKFQTLSKVDDDRNDLIAGLRTEAMNREMVKQFPDPVDRQAFLHTLSLTPAEKTELEGYPVQYEAQRKAINAAAEPFQERKREHGSLEFGSSLLGHYVERPLGGNRFQFLLKVPERTERVYSANPQLAPPTGRAPTVPETFLTRNVEVDRNALIADSEAKVAAYDDPLAFSSDELAAVNGPRLRKEQELLQFRKTAPLPALAKMELISGLKDDANFKDTIPNDWAEQFVARPIAKVIQGFARTGAFVAGDKEMLLEPDPIEALTPGALRNRFENKSGEPIADLVSQGVESLVTYLTPGAIAKVAGRVLPMLGSAGKALAVGRAMEGAAPLAGKAGFAGFGTTSFGNSYAGRLQLAERTTDPVEAERIRAWAPFLAAADAVKEMVTEKLIPGDVESLIQKGLSGSLAKRLLNAGLVAPAKEGLEEVAGVGLEQLYLGTPGTPESQNVAEAFKGGFFGGLAFAPAAFHGSDVKPSTAAPGKFDFNGQVFTDKATAEEAKADSLARVEDTLKPAGIITQEDAVAWLQDFDRRASAPDTAPSQQEAEFADTVTALAPLLPKESGPTPVDQTGSGAANTGGDASPAGGIAPAGGVPESPTPENVVNQNIPAPVGTESQGIRVLEEYDLAESERLISTTRAGDARSKNEGKLRPEGLRSPVVLAEVPISSFTPETLEFVRTSTRQDRVDQYAGEKDFPPVYLGRGKKSGELFINDGGHRLMAAIARGDTTIKAYMKKEDVQPAASAPVVTEAPLEVAPPQVVLQSELPPPAAASRAADIESFAPGIQYFAPDTSTPVGQLLQTYAQATGRKVVLFTAGANPQSGKITDGFVIPDDRNTIYIARNTSQPLLHVLGHETSHTLEGMPEYDQFVSELRRLEPEAWERTKHTPSEFVADVVGSRFNQKEFWDRMQAEMNPSLFQKFVQFVKGVWDKLKTQLGPRNVAVNNVEAIDKMLANLLRVPAGPATVGPVLAGAQQIQPSNPELVERIDKFPDAECFNNARKWASENEVPGTLVIHGKVKTVSGKVIDHAWVEQGGTVVDPTAGVKMPRADYYAQVAAVAEAAYAPERANINMIRAKNQGPWTAEEVGNRKAELPLQQSAASQIQVEPRGRQSGFGITEDLDLYNIVQPGSKVDGTTFAVPAGADQAAVQQRAREKFTEAGEEVPAEVQQSETEFFRAGESPDDFDGTAPQVNWDAVDNYGVAWDEDTVPEHLNKPSGWAYPAMLNASDLNPSVVERTEAEEIRRMGEEQFRKEYAHEFTGATHWEGEEEVEDDDWRDIRDRVADETEASWEHSKQEMARPFKGGYPPAVVVRTDKNTFEIVDGNHRVELWQDQGFDKIPAFVYDDYLRHATGNGPIQQSEVPSDQEITDALSSDKKPFVGAHRGILPGTVVGLRIDIPAFERHGTYVVTVHESMSGGRVGKRIGYDGIAKVDNPTFFSNEKGAVKISEGSAKFPVATVEGNFNQSREMPEDLNTWEPVGYNPKTHSYFYTKKDMTTPVVGGDEAISVGNTVYVKNPQFGQKEDFLFSQVPILNATDAQAIADGATGIKNAAVDALRVKYGVEGARVVTREAREDVLAEALRKIKAEPYYQDNLINRLHAKPAPVEPVDAAILMLAALDSQQESEAAAVQTADLANTGQPVGDALARLAAANARLRTLLDINDATGTLAGRTLNFRRYMLQRDYTFVRMEKSFQSAANQGAALNAQQLAYVQAMNRKLNDAEKRIKELESRNLDAEVEGYVTKFFGELEKARAKVKTGLTEKQFRQGFKTSAEQSRNRLKARFKNAIVTPTIVDDISLSETFSLSPEERADMVVLGAFFIEEGVDTLDAFRDRLTKELGDEAAVFAESTFAAAKELRASLRDKHKPARNKAKPSTDGAAEARKDAAKATVDDGETVDGQPPRELVRAIVKQNVEAGLRGAREVFPAALADLQPIYPDLTEDDLKRIFSNYGKAIFPSKDEVKMELTELASIGRLEVTIADLEKGLPALRTGPQRQEATDEIRRLQKQVNELKRKHGFTQRTESQLKGALDAAKTRLRNEIEDLTTYIEAGGRTPDQRTGKTPTVGDAELDDLRKQRDELRNELATIEGPDLPTEAERIEATVKALKRAEETLTARLEAGPLAGRATAAPTVTSEEIEERRSYVTTLREMIQEEKDAVRPMAVPALKQLDKAQAALDRLLGILDGSHTVEAPVPTAPLSRAEEDILLQIAAARQLLADEKASAAAPARALAAAQKALERMEGIMDGSFTPEPGKERQAFTQAEEDLRLQVAAMRQALAEEKRVATAPQRALDAAQRTVDALAAILEGTGTRKAPASRAALTQAEEDLRSQAAAMRQLLADEAREAGAPARQLKAAQASLERLEALLAAPAGTSRTPAAPLSQAEEEIRQQILTVKGELAALRAADPALSLERQKKAITTRMETLKAKLKAGDFTRKKARAPVTPDADLERLQAEYVLVQKEWHRRLYEESLKSRTPGQQVKDFIGETLKLARITELGFDFGIILRQGGRTLGRPDLFATAITAGAKSLTEVGQQKEWQKITSDPQFQLALRMGLEITDPDDIVAYKKEEAFQSRWLMKEWKVKPGDSAETKALKFAVNAPLGTSRALARGQIIAIDKIRFGMWKALSATLSRHGAPTEAEMRSYARMANASTGRGSIDAEWERGVGTLFLAYRWAKSGLEYVTLRPLWQPVLSGEATLRSSAVIAAEYARNLSGIGLFILAWYAAHWKDDDDKWKIEWDPRSPRFAKLPIGADTLVDPTAGLSQWVVLLSKMITGEKKSQSGKIMQLSETDDGKKPAFGQGRGSELLSFLRYKLNPVLGAGISITTGRDAVGEKTSVGKEVQKMVVPLMIEDVRKAVKSNGFPDGYALSLAAFFGMSIQTWEEKHKENLPGADRVWLYKHALSVPALSDSATVGDVLGDDAKDQKRRKTDVLLTDEQKKALLTESLPRVQQEVQKIRTRAALIPAGLTLEKQAAKMADLQNDLNRKVQQARERTLRKSLKPAP